MKTSVPQFPNWEVSWGPAIPANLPSFACISQLSFYIKRSLPPFLKATSFDTILPLNITKACIFFFLLQNAHSYRNLHVSLISSLSSDGVSAVSCSHMEMFPSLLSFSHTSSERHKGSFPQTGSCSRMFSYQAKANFLCLM